MFYMNYIRVDTQKKSTPHHRPTYAPTTNIHTPLLLPSTLYNRVVTPKNLRRKTKIKASGILNRLGKNDFGLKYYDEDLKKYLVCRL